MNFASLPLDTRRLIVAYLQRSQEKGVVALIGEADRWDDLLSQLKHTILNGTGGEAVLEETRKWVEARAMRSNREARYWVKFESVKRLLLKCKIASVKNQSA